MTTGLAAADAAPRRVDDGYIPGIDGLRAIAVLAVMVGHLGRSWLPGGFTGVDVFFTISGFVVTLSMMDHRFVRVRDMVAFFYARRLRRIVPALIVMLLVATLASVLFVPDAWLSEAIPTTGLAAFFGISNIVLAAQTEVYFAPRAEFNTFLHTWSLGVEEQFYLVFPALIALVTVERLRPWRGRVVAVLVVLSAASLAWCAWLTPRAPVSAFFLLPTRFWELGVGMVLALTLARWRPVIARWPGVACDGLAALALAGLATTFALATEAAFPFPWAVPPVVATLLLLATVSAGEMGYAAGAFAWRPVASIGRISYSLYLWHWPVYVLMRWTCGLDGIAPRVVAVALTFGFAALSYRCVEQPFRNSARLRRRSSRVAVAGLGVAALVASAGLAKAAFALTAVLSLSQTRDAQIWSPYSAPPGNGACRAHVATRWEGALKIMEVTPDNCGATATPHLIVAGDSHAGAYLRMLRELSQARRVEVSIYASPGCVFMDLMTPAATLDASCLAANQSMHDAILARAKQGDVVFLPSLRMRRYGSDGIEGVGPTAAPQAAFDDARGFVAALVARKVRVVLEAPKPVFKSPPFRCVDGFDRINPVCNAGFSEGRAEFERKRAPILDRERALAALPGVSIWDPSTVLCGPSTCDAFADDKPLVFDTDHLTGTANDLLLPSFEAHLGALH